MSAYLLLVTLGPVQEFIAQARRTRDLWFGSHLLSELSRAVACALAEKDGPLGHEGKPIKIAYTELVFPPLEKGDTELEPCAGPLRSTTGRAPLNIANKLLTVVPDGEKPEAAARAAREAANEAWRGFAAKVKRKCRGLLAEGIDASWEEQIETLLEFNAAWLPLDESRGNYDEVRRELEAVITARKNLRDFPAWTRQRGNVPKSSLDGARETVLAPPEDRAPHLVRRYRIAAGEQLDAVGLVKRAGGEPEQFVPVVNVALASWIEHAVRIARDEMEKLAEACGEVGIGRIDRPDLSWTASFSYDAQVFLEDRWSPILAEALNEDNARDAREWGKRLVRPVFEKGMRAPHPYVACLVADGDRIGNALSNIHERKHHRIFAHELSRFAERARVIIEREYRGVLVYAGGDDVLAFIGLNDALECAEALRRAFEEVMVQAFSAVEKSTESPAPTLSVGLGIGHVLESMGELLSLARRAEQHAKRARPGEGEHRNALAILADKRSGGDVSWRMRWDGATNPVTRLRADITLLGDRLPGKKIFEIQSDLVRMPTPEDLMASEDRPWAELLAADTARTLARASDGQGVSPEEVGLDLEIRAGYTALHRRVERWLARMLVARLFGDARRAGEPGRPLEAR